LKKGYKGLGMEGIIAKWYAKITLKDLEEFRTLAKRITETLKDGNSVLELAPGPGYLAIELAKLGNYKIVGLDISKTFVEIARKKAREVEVAVEFQQGNAADIPFDEESFDFIVCRAAFKNFTEPLQTLNEICRVLKTHGKALIIDLRRDVPQESIDQYVKSLNLGIVNKLVTKLIFKYMLIRRAYTEKEFKELVAKAGFRKIDIAKTLTGFEVWLEK
jgi:ubiquinone/menaquinone biosynthesis C-methylase UbiE